LDAEQKPMNCTNGDVDKINRGDCFTEGLQFVQEHAVYLGGVAIGISCFMILGMFFSIFLFKLIE
jgi:ABC-type multidrug transport system permease subunit